MLELFLLLMFLATFCLLMLCGVVFTYFVFPECREEIRKDLFGIAKKETSK